MPFKSILHKNDNYRKIDRKLNAFKVYINVMLNEKLFLDYIFPKIVITVIIISISLENFPYFVVLIRKFLSRKLSNFSVI